MSKTPNFISILAKGSSLNGRNILTTDCLIKTGDPGGNRPFKDSGKGFELSAFGGVYWNDEKYGQHSISHVLDTGPLSELNYRLMIRLPEYVTPAAHSHS